MIFIITLKNNLMYRDCKRLTKMHMNMKKNKFVQFNIFNDFIFYFALQHDFEIDENIENKLNDIYKLHNDNILHIVLFDEYFVIYERNNVAYTYVFVDDDIIYDDNEHYHNYEQFIKYFKKFCREKIKMPMK